jgi:hypothetical protein
MGVMDVNMCVWQSGLGPSTRLDTIEGWMGDPNLVVDDWDLPGSAAPCYVLWFGIYS